MAKITPVINGDMAPVHGSFVVSPGMKCSLDLDGLRLDLEFINDESGISKVVTSESGGIRTLTVMNPLTDYAAFDVKGYQIGGTDIRLSLAFLTIGEASPHRVVTYTLIADKTEIKS